MDTALQPISSGSVFRVVQRDIIAELLRDKRSPNTRAAYARDLKEFFLNIAGQAPTPQLVADFLSLDRAKAIGLTLQFKADLIERGLAEATINRNLAAIKSLVNFAQRIDQCQWSLEAVEGEKSVAYRDTTGISIEEYQKLLGVCDRDSLKGKRDYAIFRLLWDNALRRGEIVQCNVGDLNLERRSLAILGKGKGTQKQAIELSARTTEALRCWLVSRGNPVDADPLFLNLDHPACAGRLSAWGLYKLVVVTAKRAGIGKHLSPHKCRHSSITAALEATNGDVRRVQKLSRHSRIETLMVYDDNRSGMQGQVTDLLSELV